MSESVVVFIDEITLDLVDDKAVFVEEDSQYRGQLCVQNIEQSEFRTRYPVYLSRYNVLVSNGLWDYFSQVLHDDGYIIYILPTAQRVLEQHTIDSEPLVIEGLKVPNDGELFEFQQYGLRRAFDAEDFFFFNYGTGSGKTVIGAAGVQELLLNRGKVDLVLAFTLASMKINYQRALDVMTGAKVVVVKEDRAPRLKQYKDPETGVFVLNYEKCHFDKKALIELVSGKRVLFILDEVQKVLNKETQARKGLDQIITASEGSVCWPLSASVVKADPDRYRRVYEQAQVNPLGNEKTFEAKYLDRKEVRWVRTKSGYGYEDIIRHWSQSKLQEVRHRVAPWTHAVRKTDPGVAHLFKGLAFEKTDVQMSPQDRELYDLIGELAEENEKDPVIPEVQFYEALRMICNTPEGLMYWDSALGRLIRDSGINASSRHSAKLTQVCDMIEEIREQGDKALLFTSRVKLSLEPIARELQKRRISHVVHHGQMTNGAKQYAQDQFKAQDGITVFLSSDAGAQGLNFQEARFVLNYEVPYDYDLLMQRINRIDRADSYLEGLTSYGFVTENSVEERIWSICNFRRRQSEAIQGTDESLGYEAIDPNASEENNLKWLLFGNRRTNESPQ